MKLINQSCKLENQTDFSLMGILKQIELAARVSYLSWDKITEDSYKEFVERLIKNKEYRPLEFGTIHLIIPISELSNFISTLRAYDLYNPLWIKYNIYTENKVYVTTNYRLYLELIKNCKKYENYVDFSNENNSKYPVRHTIHFDIARGILDEFRTHIGLSHIASSTRYINLSKEKFGKQITIVKPYNVDIPLGMYTFGNNNLLINGVIYITRNKVYAKYLKHLIDTENLYFAMLEDGFKPQDARDILPLGIESHLYSCGFEDMWTNFFKLRCAKNAHPLAREIALKAYNLLKDKIICDDIKTIIKENMN